MGSLSAQTLSLIGTAMEARKLAYAPYSGYPVGAALIDERGQSFTGCNVENVSYPASICAERTALVKMVSEGGRELKALAVATRDGGAPCGICLQCLAEFTKKPESVAIFVVDENGNVAEFTLKELIPHAFFSNDVASKNHCTPESPLQ